MLMFLCQQLCTTQQQQQRLFFFSWVSCRFDNLTGRKIIMKNLHINLLFFLPWICLLILSIETQIRRSHMKNFVQKSISRERFKWFRPLDSLQWAYYIWRHIDLTESWQSKKIYGKKSVFVSSVQCQNLRINMKKEYKKRKSLEDVYIPIVVSTHRKIHMKKTKLKFNHKMQQLFRFIFFHFII